MPLPFALVCELLEESYSLCISRRSNKSAVERWFTRYRTQIDAHDTSLPALLSTLLPEKRSDRVYCIQAFRLEKIIGRALAIRTSRMPELARYKQPGSGADLADCVERILSITPNQIHTGHKVTVEDVDELLHGLASTIRWSSPSIRASQTTLTQRNREDLGLFYQRLTSLEAKWFTRLVLKSYAPLIFHETLVYYLSDSTLPSVLKIREDFTAAVSVVQSARNRLLPNTGRKPLQEQLLEKVKPQLGIKVGRQHWKKARSIQHCLSLGKGRMSVEQKVDGEYCQIHIDLSKGAQCVQMFSKSGKDSTEDREALHSIIKSSLRIGKPGCRFAKACILEGELAVYNDLDQKVAPFHKIRNYITRRGRYMNTEYDSPWVKLTIRVAILADQHSLNAHEHLMIVYYDMLLLDDESLLGVRHSERLKLLATVVETQKGWAELVQREIVDFGGHSAASNLRKAFAKTIINKQEGLVLKPDEPYFDFSIRQRPRCGLCIKFKKEYVGKFGDVGDFAVVGAGYDPIKAKQYDIPNLEWTHFYVGCLDNREEVKRWSLKPEFTVVNVVELNETQLKSVKYFGRPEPVRREANDRTTIKLAPGVEKHPRMSVAFTNPLVFDLRCFSFDKDGDMGFWTLRFPSVTKVHFDRSWVDTTFSFEELQVQAREAVRRAEEPDSQENLRWIARLEGADPRGIAVDAVSQLTTTSGPTPSPCRSTQNAGRCWSQSPTAVRAVVREPSDALLPNTSEQVPCEPAPPAAPLNTPPTSSAPGEQASKQLSGKRSRSRGSSMDSKASPPYKKYKPIKAHTPPSKAVSPKTSAGPARRPLAEVDINVSQRSAMSEVMDSHSRRPSEPTNLPTIVDLASSPDASFAANEMESSSPRTERPPSQESDAIVVMPEEEEDEDPTSSSPAPSHASVSESTRGSEAPSHGVVQRTGCVHAGGQCQFSTLPVFLAPHLVNRPDEVADLLAIHGIQDATTDVISWMKDTNARMRASQQTQDRRSKPILLVDSLGHGAEMEALLKELDEARKTHALGSRDWITVYDWRVLEYITIMEDQSITRKYYDGFNDPWRRWYCGLV